MRARNLKPEFFVDEDLGECSIEARMLFAGLWCVADRLGRLEDRPRRLKGQLFPYDAIEIEPLLAELQQAEVIERYEIAGHRYIAIPNFLKHQSPYYNEKESIIPAPPNYDLRNVASPGRKKATKSSKRGSLSSEVPASAEQLLANPQPEQIQRETASACSEPEPSHGQPIDATASGEDRHAQQLLAEIVPRCSDSYLLIPDSGSLISDVLSSDSGLPAVVASGQVSAVSEDRKPEETTAKTEESATIKKAFSFRFSLVDSETGSLNFDQGKLLAKYRELTGNHPKERDAEIARQMWTEGVFTFPSLMELMDVVFVRSAGRGIGSLAYFKQAIGELSQNCIDAGIAVARRDFTLPRSEYERAVLLEVRREVEEWSGRILKEAV